MNAESFRWLSWAERCFTSTETVGLLGTGAQDGHFDFHTVPELWRCAASLVTAMYHPVGHYDVPPCWSLRCTILLVATMYRLSGRAWRQPTSQASPWSLQCTASLEVILQWLNFAVLNWGWQPQQPCLLFCTSCIGENESWWSLDSLTSTKRPSSCEHRDTYHGCLDPWASSLDQGAEGGGGGEGGSSVGGGGEGGSGYGRGYKGVRK